MKTIIVVPDFTRKAHLKKILPTILKGKKGSIEIIIATGLHRSPTKKQIRKNLGALADKAKVSVHNYRKNAVEYFGKTKKGISVYLNKKLRTADSIITVGVVEPHLYAGYSGGIKVVSIGLAGEKTINATHHPRFLDHPKTKICSITKNPFRDFIDDAGRTLPIRHSVNIINNRNGKLLKVFCGHPKTSFKNAVTYSREIFEKKIDKLYDVVICDIPKEKAVNIYQASRAFNYVANTKKCILKNNAIILVKADLKDGFGRGLGEKRFEKTMTKMKDPKRLIRNIKKKGCLAGEHRAYMVAKAIQKAELGFISNKADLYKNKILPFLFFKDLKEARKYISKKSKTCYLKNAFNAILVKKP